MVEAASWREQPARRKEEEGRALIWAQVEGWGCGGRGARGWSGLHGEEVGGRAGYAKERREVEKVAALGMRCSEEGEAASRGKWRLEGQVDARGLQAAT